MLGVEELTVYPIFVYESQQLRFWYRYIEVCPGLSPNAYVKGRAAH